MSPLSPQSMTSRERERKRQKEREGGRERETERETEREIVCYVFLHVNMAGYK
jgi:hypothetical protein